MKPEELVDEAVRHDHGPLPEAGALGRWVVAAAPIFAVGIAISMAALLVEIVMRYVFESPTLWAHETTTFLTSVAFVFGGLYCVSTDKHIRVVIVYDYLRPRAKRVMDVLISVVNLASVVFMAWAAWQMVARSAFAPDGSVKIETSGSAWDPMFPGVLKIFLLVVLVVMAIQFVRLAIGYIRGR